jgi:hypothetical protein
MRLAAGPWRGESRRGAVRVRDVVGTMGVSPLWPNRVSWGEFQSPPSASTTLKFLVDTGGGQHTQGVVDHRFQLSVRRLRPG